LHTQPPHSYLVEIGCDEGTEKDAKKTHNHQKEKERKKCGGKQGNFPSGTFAGKKQLGIIKSTPKTPTGITTRKRDLRLV